MKDRKNKLIQYNEDVDNIKDINEYNIKKLDEILKYLLAISNYPMQPVQDNVNTIAGHILKIFGKGEVFLDIMYNCAHNSQNNICKNNIVICCHKSVLNFDCFFSIFSFFCSE